MKRRNFFASLFATALVPAVVKGMETETTVSGGIVSSGSVELPDSNVYADWMDGELSSIAEFHSVQGVKYWVGGDGVDTATHKVMMDGSIVYRKQ